MTHEEQAELRLLLGQTGAVVTGDNQLEVICQGEVHLEKLLADLQSAEQFIHLQYYIIRNDPTSWRILEMLAEKAKTGVEVAVLYDGLGSLGLPEQALAELRHAGGQAIAWLPVSLRNLRQINYRNHRKICVIDGRSGYIGGYNIGDEYAGRPDRFACWRDLQLRIQGSALDCLERTFQQDWRLASGATASRPLRQWPQAERFVQGGTEAQIVTSGPNALVHPIRTGMLQMIKSAHKHIQLQTPYFIPDKALQAALRRAALSGVKVQVLAPGKPDHPLVLPAGLSFMGELLPAGVQFFFYQPGFLHSKMLTVDGTVSTLGSANFDRRSFYIDYEINAFIYSRQLAATLEGIFAADLAGARELTLHDYGKRGWWRHLEERCARLFAPWL